MGVLCFLLIGGWFLWIVVCFLLDIVNYLISR
jgi:hypothetical protein